MVHVLNPNLVLIGFMGVGKTTVGRRCARVLGFRMTDTDGMIERRAGRSIPEIFATWGEERFREMEAEVIREASARVHAVIATGGGAILRPENVRVLRSSGVLIWLWVAPEEILRRCGDRMSRPLLTDATDPSERVRSLLEVRTPLYAAAADVRVETTGLTHGEAAERVLQEYRRLAAGWSELRQDDGCRRAN